MSETKESIINGRKEGISFYESQLPEDMLIQCRECKDVEEDYVKNLIEKYKEYSVYTNGRLKKINGERR